MEIEQTQAESPKAPAAEKGYYLGLVGRGLAMGAADVVPGVSGGTMALILGVYEDLLAAINAVKLRPLLRLRLREAFAGFPWRFLLALGTGILIAFVTLAEALSWALDHHPNLVWGFFFGLVLASILVIARQIRPWTLPMALATALFALGMYLVTGMVPAETPHDPWFIVLSGALAISGMMLPGISGAFILVLLGKYEYMLDAFVSLDWVTLVLFAGGAMVGLFSIARLLRWLFQRYHDVTIAALIGLLIGSLRKIWPWKEILSTTTDRHGEVIPLAWANVLPSSLTVEVSLTIALAIVGILLVLGLEAVASRRVSPADSPAAAAADR